MNDERKLTFKPDQFHTQIFMELVGWMQEGITDFAMLMDDPAHERCDVQRDVGMVMRDGCTVCVVDVTGGLHLFRMSLERL